MKTESRVVSFSRFPDVRATKYLLVLFSAICGWRAAAVPVDLPGVDAITYIKDGVQIVEGLDKVLKILNPNPIEGLVPKASMTFSESASQAVLSLSGGNFGTPDQSQTFSITGTYWSLNFGVTQDAAAVVGFDSVALSGSITHQKGPHSSDGIGDPMQFSSIIIFGGNQCCGGDSAEHPNNDSDAASYESEATYKNIVDPIFGLTLSSDITTWTWSLRTRHSAVPDRAGTLALFLGSMLFVMACRCRWLQRGSIPAPS